MHTHSLYKIPFKTSLIKPESYFSLNNAYMIQKSCLV